jgi:hypothetical protein
MRTHPPPPGMGGGRAVYGRLPDRGSDANPKSNARVTDKLVEGYLKFAKRECQRLDAGPICRKFAAEAESRYAQFQKTGAEDLRRLSWSAIQLCARHLEREAGR